MDGLRERSLAREAALARSDGELGPDLEQLHASLLRSPWWADRLRERGVGPGDLRRVEDLAALPTTDRATLRAHWEAMAIASDDLAGAALGASSGSTGDPVPVLRDAYDQAHMWAVIRFWVRRLEIDLPEAPTIALLCTLPSGLEYAAPAPLLYGGRSVRVSTMRPRALERLLGEDPAILSSDPAGLAWLLEQPERPRPRLVLSGAQSLAPSLRARVEATFGVPLIDYYACAEAGPIAWSCPRTPSAFHVLSPDVVVESLGGELVVTRLRPSVLPLVRYRTGDRGVVAFERCGCGATGPTIRRFEGRLPVWFRRPSGERFDAWQLAWVFRGRPLAAFRLEQHGAERFGLQVVGEDGGVGATLEDALRAAGWTDPRVVVEPVAAIARPGGKLACFVGGACEAH